LIPKIWINLPAFHELPGVGLWDRKVSARRLYGCARWNGSLATCHIPDQSALIPTFAKRDTIIKDNVTSYVSYVCLGLLNMLSVVNHLKVSMFFQDPGALFPYEGTQDW